MGDRLSRETILRILFSLAFAGLWTSLTSSYLTAEWEWDLARVEPVPMWLSQIISIPLLGFTIAYVLRIRELERRVVATFVAYAAVFLLLFLSYAPGCLPPDAYYVFHMVRNGFWSGWYSPLHPALTTACFQIVPWGFHAPGLVLALLWAVVFTAIHRTLISLASPRAVHVAVPLLVFAPAQILSAILIIRDSFFAVLLLWFLLLILGLVRARVPARTRVVFNVALLGGLLMAYRTDAIPSVVAGLALVSAMNPGPLARWKAVAAKGVLMIVPISLVFLYVHAIPLVLDRDWARGNTWSTRAEDEYKLTLIENPLGYIVKQPDRRISDGDRASIEKVFRFEDLEKHWCPEMLCLFHDGLWNEVTTDKDRDEAFRAALRVFAGNPRLFLESRLATLRTVGDSNPQSDCSRELMARMRFLPSWSTGSLYSFGRSMVDFVHATETPRGLLGGMRTWWNVPLFVIACIVFASTATATPAVSVASLLLLGRTLVVVLTAPAGFSTYYLPLFVGVPFLAIFWILELREWRSGNGPLHGMKGA